MKHSTDGKFVVTQDGQRAGGLHEEKAKADAEADKLRRQLQEQKGGGGKPADVSVKRNLLG